MPQIVCRDLSLGYDGVSVCDRINFSVNKGDYLCVVGENGSGKSTLIKALLGLKSPDGGEIIKENTSNIGYLPQQSEMQRDFPATALEVVLSGRVAKLGKRFFYSREDKRVALQCLERLGLSELASKSYGSLSGGQQQRALLARALCATGELLLLDEPVSGLDPAATEDMYNLISELNRNEKITVIMVTHDISAALRYATHVLHMSAVPEFFGSAEEYKNSDCFAVGRGEQYE